MTWRVVLANSAARTLRRAPVPDQQKIRQALHEIEADPFSGDTKLLKGSGGSFRRRAGVWRMLFELHAEDKIIVVTDILRRGSHTY